MVLGKLQLQDAGVVLGKSLLPTPPSSSERHFFDLTCRIAFCLAPSPYMLVMESLFVGHYCQLGTSAHAACWLPGAWQQQEVHGTDKGSSNRMLGV